MATKDKLVNLEDLKSVYDHGMDLLDEKANQVGEYVDLTAGYADNLVSSSYVSDSEPYLFRKTFAGVREDTELVGGSVVWNQLARTSQLDASKTQNGVTIKDNRDGTYTVSTDANGATANTYCSLSNANILITNGHKYLLFGTPTTGNVNTYYSYLAGAVTVYDYGNGLVFSARATVPVTPVVVYVKQGTIIETPITFKPQVIDLTLMFGATVADYIYSLETATAGAGVAWCKAYNPKMFSTYQPYNAGTLMSVNASAHKMVGFNQWDEEWELGSYSSSTGEKTTTSNYMRSKNYISVFPQVAYYFKTPFSISSSSIYIFYYDANMAFLEGGRKWSVNQTTPANARYMTFSFATASYGSSTYNNDICINLSDPSKNGTYEPYTEVTYPLSSIDLRGIPTIVDGKLKYDGDVYKSGGTVTRRYGLLDMGSVNWTRYENASLAGGGDFGYTLNERLGGAVYGFMISPRYTISSARGASQQPAGLDKAIFTGTGATQKNIYVIDSEYSTVEEFKTAMSGVYLLYTLETPTTETAEPYTNPQVCYPDGTEEYIDAREVPIPVGHNTKYMRDLKKLLEGIPDAPTANGTYVLKATVSSSGVTYSWVAG